MSTSVRDQVKALLAPLVAETGWAVKAHTVKQITTLSKPTLYIEHIGIVALPEAPVGHVSNTVVVTILDDHTNYDTAEDALDDDVLQLITALDASDRLLFVKADKTEVNNTYLGWAIELTLTTEKEN